MRGTSEAAQAKRRQKVMDEAVLLAARGGLEALRIRDVVARTGVSSATIYRYFASKEHLLVAALAEQRFAIPHLGDAPREGTTPAERVIDLLRAPTDALTSAPRLAAAMLQAMTSGEPGVAPNANLNQTSATSPVVRRRRSRPRGRSADCGRRAGRMSLRTRSEVWCGTLRYLKPRGGS